MKKIYNLLLLCSIVSMVNAQWTNNTRLNTLVANKDASDIQMANTNDGRTWIAFYSNSGSNYDMRAQLLDVNGNRMLGDTGILVSNARSGSATFVFNVCVDNDNNFIIAFQVAKGSAYECVMQKISLTGQLLWGSRGVDLGPGLAPYPATLSTNEIAVAWNDNSGRIAYQKVSAAGVSAYSPAKIFTGNSGHIVSRAQVVAGTNGKFSMVYQDQFSAPFYTHLFTQKFNNNGNTVWTKAVQISTLTTVSYRYYNVFSENDTTYVGYYGNPATSNRFDAYVQRINANGILYSVDGSGIAPVLTSNNDRYEQTVYIAKKPGSNKIWAICTVTNSLQTESGVYVQKFNAHSGFQNFGFDGKEILPVSADLNSLAFCQLSLCDDNPFFLVTNNTNKLAAIKLNSDGSFAWKNDLRLVGSSTTSKFRYGFTDFYKGQAVAVWQEDKGAGTMPYAQNIRCNGSTGSLSNSLENNLPTTEAALSIKSLYPNPVQSNLSATVTSSVQANVYIYITDVNGNVISQLQQNFQKGDNLIQLNVSALTRGSYFIKVINKNGSAATMFSKQ
jgi:hypothetical protein